MFQMSPAVHYPTGIQCIELNIREADEAIREFVAITGKMNVVSWKYPHLKIETLNVGELMENYKSKNSTNEFHYQELLELLIDRLYYSFVASLNFFQKITESLSKEIVNKKVKALNVAEFVDFFDISKNNSVGKVIKQLFDLYRNMEYTILTYLAEIKGSGKGDEFKCLNSACKLEHVGKADLEVQTEDNAAIMCCSCCATVRILKTVGDTIETCLSVFGVENSNLSVAKVDIRSTIYWCSQWSAVTRWVDAMRADSSKLITLMTEKMRENKLMEEEIELLDNTIKTREYEHTVTIEQLNSQITTLNDELTKVIAEKEENEMLKCHLEQNISEMEVKLRMLKQKEDIDSNERNQLQVALINIEKLNAELQYNHNETSNNYVQLQYHFENVAKEKESLQSLASDLELKLETQIKTKEIESQTEVCENRRLRQELQNLQNNYQILQEEKETLVYKQKQTVMEFEQTVKANQKQLDILTLYPDLNGPINPPHTHSENVLETLELQIEANQLRIQLLRDQTSRLLTTTSKLKDHMINRKHIGN